MKTTKWFGLALDNPSPIPVNRWKNLVGNVLDSYTKEDLEFLEKNDYFIITLPKYERALICEFPYVSLISPFIGAPIAYQAMKKYVDQNKVAQKPSFTFELYDPNGKKIVYIRPLDVSREEFEKVYYKSREINIAQIKAKREKEDREEKEKEEKAKQLKQQETPATEKKNQ